MTTFTFVPSHNLSTTTGEPNSRTGRLSKAGKIVVGAHTEKGIVGGRAKMRQFCLGLSVEAFNERMDYIEELGL
jgi:hypothetical protein